MADPSLVHEFAVGDLVRGRPDAGLNDRRIRGRVTSIEPHIEGQARNVLVEGRYIEDGESLVDFLLPEPERRMAHGQTWCAFIGTELEPWDGTV